MATRVQCKLQSTLGSAASADSLSASASLSAVSPTTSTAAAAHTHTQRDKLTGRLRSLTAVCLLLSRCYLCERIGRPCCTVHKNVDVGLEYAVCLCLWHCHCHCKQRSRRTNALSLSHSLCPTVTLCLQCSSVCLVCCVCVCVWVNCMSHTVFERGIGKFSLLFSALPLLFSSVLRAFCSMLKKWNVFYFSLLLVFFLLCSTLVVVWVFYGKLFYLLQCIFLSGFLCVCVCVCYCVCTVWQPGSEGRFVNSAKKQQQNICMYMCASSLSLFVVSHSTLPPPLSHSPAILASWNLLDWKSATTTTTTTRCWLWMMFTCTICSWVVAIQYTNKNTNKQTHTWSTCNTHACINISTTHIRKVALNVFL